MEGGKILDTDTVFSNSRARAREYKDTDRRTILGSTSHPGPPPLAFGAGLPG